MQNVQHTENAGRYGNDMPYKNDISYSYDATASQSEVSVQDTGSEDADDETSETSEDSITSFSNDQLYLKRYKMVRDGLRSYEFGGPSTAGKIPDNGRRWESPSHDFGEELMAGNMSDHRHKRERAPSPPSKTKKRRLNSWGAYTIYR